MSRPADLDYPCAFPIKVFLHPSPEAEAVIEETVRRAVTGNSLITVERRLSRSDRYLCLTVTFTASDPEHVRRIGAAVGALKEVLLVI